MDTLSKTDNYDCPTREAVEQTPPAVIFGGNRIPVTTMTAWGKDQLLDTNPFYMVKWITVDPGQSLSVQAHEQKVETYILIKGQAEVRVGLNEEVIYFLNADDPGGNVLFLPAWTVHRLIAGPDGVVLIEASTPYATDTVRLHDPHGRGHVTPISAFSRCQMVLGTGR